MRILVNYQQTDQNFLPILQYHLRSRNLQAIATTLPLTIGELIMKAKNANCEAILICNNETLKQCVSSPKATLDLYRGSVLRFSIPAVVCNPIAHTQTVEYGTWLLGKDLDKFKTIHQELREEDKFSFVLLDSVSEMNKAKKELSDAILIAYDIETKTTEDINLESGETFITCASWTLLSKTNKTKTYVLPMVDFLEDHWKTDEEYIAAIRFMQEVNALPIPKVMHNGMYDSIHSIAYRAWPNHWTLDTMAMAHSEFSSLPKSLDFVASITLNDYLQWKTDSEEASKNKDIHQYWGYNGKDTWHTLRICIHYLRHLPAYAKKNYALQFPLVYPCLYASYEGIKVDEAECNILRDAAQKKVDEALIKLRTMLSDKDFNPASPKQVKTYIYDVMGAADPHIGQKKDAKTGRRTRMVQGSDEKNLKAIGEQHPILLRLTDAILSYRESAKAISTYFNFTRKNGRLLWSLNPFGTDTGRMACSASSFWCGTQVQNIPFYAKGFLVADPDYILIELDNSQSEARCTGYLAKEWHLVEALENPAQDFYTSLGTLFFGIPYPEVTKALRNEVLKKIVHGTNYMMGAATFIENAGVQKLISGAALLNIKILPDRNGKNRTAEGMTLKEFATYLLDAYHNPFPRVREWYKEVALEIATTSKLVSPLGYTRHFFGDIGKNHNMLRGAVAHAPQNLSVSILNIGLWKIWGMVKASKSLIRFKAQIHDSVFLQVHKSILTETVPLLRHALDNKVKVHGRFLSIPVDYKFGKSWGGMEEVKTPKG